jgi:O-antigen/teichoic acid export membrane protein
MAVLAVMCFQVLGREGRPSSPDLRTAKELLTFGAWMTVSNVIGPLMVLFDRFVVSATISVAIVTFYATPFQVAMQLLIIPTAVTTVLFPAFSAAFAHTPAKLGRLFWSGIKLTISAGYPIGLILIALAPEILEVWLGRQFTILSTGTLRWITIGVLLNGVAHFPFALIQSAGRSDYTAKIHLLELPLYLAALTFVAMRFGITGVAIVWAARSLLDLCLLMIVAFRFVAPSRREVLGLVVSGAVMALPIAVIFLAPSLTVRIVVTIASIAVFLWQTWTRGFEPDQRSAVRVILSSFRLRPAALP